MIDDSITVTVIEVKGDRVKLAFDGPRDVRIHREEVYRRIMADSSEDFAELQSTH